jgi:hypothetical protein
MALSVQIASFQRSGTGRNNCGESWPERISQLSIQTIQEPVICRTISAAVK